MSSVNQKNRYRARSSIESSITNKLKGIKLLSLLGVFVCFTAIMEPAGADALSDQETSVVKAAGEVDGAQLALQQKVALTIANNPSAEIEELVGKNALKVERYCAAVVRSLTSQLTELNAKQIRTNAWGGIVALIGGVTVYAPAKAVFMGIGISSSGGGNSIMGGVANSFGTQVTVTQSRIDTLQNNYNSLITAYTGIDASTDKNGAKRGAALLMARGACDDLYPAASNTTPPKPATVPAPQP